MGLTLSLCMIVKNEEEIISRCLASVESACDEIIVVDTGSNDQTVELIKKFPQARVYNFTWIDDFAAARNESFKHATGDLILWLDADDVIKPKDLAILKDLKQKKIDEVADAYLCPYQYFHDAYDNVVLSLPRERILKRSKNPTWNHRIHEYIDYSHLRHEHSDFEVHHYRKATHTAQNGSRNLRILKQCVENPKTNCARYEYYYATELSNVGLYDEAQDYFLRYLKHWNYYEDAYLANFKIAEMNWKKNKLDDAVRFCFDALKLDQQKPEVYNLLALIYINKNHFELARFWYEAALNVNVPANAVGAVMRTSMNFTPHSQLCYVYDTLGNTEKALYHVNKALLLQPCDPTCLTNKAVLEGKLNPPTKKNTVGIYIPFNYDANNPNVRIRKLNVQKELSKQGYKCQVVQSFDALMSFDYIFSHTLLSSTQLRELKSRGKMVAYDLSEGVFDDHFKATIKEYNIVFCSSSKLKAEALKYNDNAVHLPDSYEV